MCSRKGRRSPCGNQVRKFVPISFGTGCMMNVSDWNLEKAYVFCQGNIEQKGKILYLPWYMAMFLEQEKLREKLIVDVDLSGLGIRQAPQTCASFRT